MQRLHAPVYEFRLRVLSEYIVPEIHEGDRVLDIGCGGGALAEALLDHHECPQRVTIRGVERFKRGNEPIEVDEYDGERLPYEDRSFDVVILADVIHHDEQPLRLLNEASRVCRRTLIIKDHLRHGPFAQWRLSLLDWAANHPYGVKCLYRYYTAYEWRALLESVEGELERVVQWMPLYPPPYSWIFTPGLQFLAVLSAPPSGSAPARGT